MIQIVDKKKCTGCSACVSICGKHCITMQPDSEGFLYPVVDTNCCVECGLCEKICPVLNPFDRKKEEPLCFGSRSKDTDVVAKSSSGGLFSVLAESVLQEGGIVVGAAFRKDWSVHHIIVDDEEGLERLRGSKYVQSDLDGVFIQIREELKNGRKVLFVGTPCQVAGLNHFIKNGKDALLTIDLICHSVPSPKIWKDYLNEITKNQGGVSNISSITFRDKSLGWRKYSLLIKSKTDDGKIIIIDHGDTVSNIYLKGFSQGLYNRPSCSDCPARNFKSQSDITLGDCWAVEKYYPEYKNDEEGLSVILLNTKKGLDAFKRVESQTNSFEMKYEEVEPNDMHASLTRSLPFHVNRGRFFDMSQGIPIHKRIQRCLWFVEKKNNVINAAKNSIRKIIGNQVYGFLKQLYHG